MIPKYISTSEDYQKFYYENFNELPASVRQRLLDDEELKHMRLQMVTVKLEFAKEIIESCYAKTGRRGMDPIGANISVKHYKH